MSEWQTRKEREDALRGTSALFADVGACGSGVYENDVKPVETCTTKTFRHRTTQSALTRNLSQRFL